MTGPTRYGAISAMTRTIATADADYMSGGSIGNGDTGEMGLVGAFSYGTVDETQRVHDIQTSGTAYYEGGTTAVTGNGTLYTGDIALEIRFSSNRVSGLVTNLQTAEGDGWVFQYGEVDSIILATASNLNNTTAEWGVTAAQGDTNAARVTFESRAGSTLPTAVAGTFQGQLLGRGDESGNHAHGTWSVGAQRDSGSAAYLAGSFGAARVDDVAPVRPGLDDGDVHETVVTSNDGVAEASLTNAFKIDAGNLVVTMNRAGRYLANATEELPDPDDMLGDGATTLVRTILGAEDTASDLTPLEPTVLTAADRLFMLDGDAEMAGRQNATHELKQSLADLVANPQSDRNVNGPDSQVGLAVKEIEAARGDLVALQALESRVTASEQAAWRRVQAALLRLFQHVPPKVAEAYDEDDAVGLIDQVLDALASQANLEGALDRDGRGIFNDVTKGDETPATADPAVAPSAPSGSLIYGRQEVQLKTHGGSTDFTRWGVWRVRTDNYAGRDAWTNFNDGDTNGNAPGSFAYSQLLPTRWSDQNDPGFPGGGRATFEGGTTGLIGTAFYDGDVMVTAEWDATWDGTAGDPLGRWA